MEFFPALMTFTETETMVEIIRERQSRHGFCFWAAELKETGAFIGFIGLNVPDFETHFTPCVEIGWRLALPFWGKGYATEGAHGALQYGFINLCLKEIVSFTSVKNIRSRRVMEKIGMWHDSQGDFDHPKLAANSPIRPHVLYRTRRSV